MFLSYGMALWHQGTAGVGSTREEGELGAEADSKTLDEGCSPTVCKEEQNGLRVSHSPLVTRQPVVMWQV